MKRAITGILVIASLFFTGSALAAQFVNQKNLAKIEAGQTVDDDVFMTGESIVVDGTINGDLYAAGDAVTINGTVNGDVYALSSKIEVKGTIRDDLITAGQSITITGTIGDSVTAAAEVINAEKSAAISGGVLAAASELNVRSSVGRGIMAAGEKIVLDGSVGRQVLLMGSTITLNSGTKINGDLRYRSNESLIKNQGSEITGQTIRHFDEGRGINWGLMLWSFMSLAIVGLILIRLMPTAMPAIAGAITRSPLPVIGWGLLTAFLAPPLIILLLISIIGIPLALLTAIMYGVLLYLSHTFTALAVGGMVLKHSNSRSSSYSALLIGLAILTILGLIPVFGSAISILAGLFGLGGVMYYAKNRLALNSYGRKSLSGK